MSRKLEHLRARRSAALYARTLQGRIFNFGGWLFAVYCIFRIISVRTAFFLSFSGNSSQWLSQ